MSRLENMPSRIEAAGLTAALVDIFCRSFPQAPATITLDIDDTCDRVHGLQQMSSFHAHHDTRCFLPIHVYHVESGKPVVVFLRPGNARHLYEDIYCIRGQAENPIKMHKLQLASDRTSCQSPVAILDNYAAHKHPRVIAWLRRHPRFVFHFTPTSCSWLNAVETFLAKLTKRRVTPCLLHRLKRL